LLPYENISFRKVKTLILIVLLGLSFILSQSVSSSRSIKLSFSSFLDANNTSILLALITCILIHYLIRIVPQNKCEIVVEKLGGKLASFSYSLYLTHFPLMILLAYYGFPKSAEVNIKSITLFLIEIIIALIVSYFIYFISERHTQKVKNVFKAYF